MKIKLFILMAIVGVLLGCGSKKTTQNQSFYSKEHSFSITYDSLFKPLPKTTRYTLLKSEMYQRILAIRSTPASQTIDLNNEDTFNNLIKQLELPKHNTRKNIVIDNRAGVKMTAVESKNYYNYYLFTQRNYLIVISFKSTLPQMHWADTIIGTLTWDN